MNRSFRSKPIGWRHESYRHYLAAKGIVSRVPPHKYFASIPQDYLKGRRKDGNLSDEENTRIRQLNASGFSNDEAYRMIGREPPAERKQVFTAVGGVQVPFEEMQSLPIGGVPVVESVEQPMPVVSMPEPPVAEVPDLGLPGASLAPEMATDQTFSPAFSQKAEVPRHENLDDTAANMTPGSPGMVTDEFEVTTG